MRNLASSFTMRKDGVLPRGDWFKIVENKKEASADVYLYDEIGFWGTSAQDFVNDLKELDAKTINVFVNSPGGEIFDGLAIYNGLRALDAEVVVHVTGLAASAASFIAQAGDKVVMARNAQMMIHDGIAMAYGNEADMLDTAELLGKLSNNIADIYHQAAKRRGTEENASEYFRGLMRAELWMDGSEAVEFGLADEITDADEDEDADAQADAKNKWDLTFYNSAGRERAESPSRVAAKAMLDNQEKEQHRMADETETETTTPPETVTPPEVPAETTPAPPADPETPTQVAPAVAPAETVTTPENKAQGVMINGKLETDWSVINQHFNSLQTAQAEQQTTHRKNSIEKLSTEGKIPATQIDSLVALVNGDPEAQIPAMSAEQYAAFMASYESLAASSLFTPHATKQDEQHHGIATTSPEMTADAKKDRISVLQGVVAMHERTMSREDVQKTNSYTELQQLLGDDKS